MRVWSCKHLLCLCSHVVAQSVNAEVRRQDFKAVSADQEIDALLFIHKDCLAFVLCADHPYVYSQLTPAVSQMCHLITAVNLS